MTLSQIKQSPDLRARLEGMLKSPEGQMLMDALEQEVIVRSRQSPEDIIKAGDTLESAMARWNAKNLWIMGWSKLVHEMRSIGHEPRAQQESKIPEPYAHAIPPHLLPENFAKSIPTPPNP